MPRVRVNWRERAEERLIEAAIAASRQEATEPPAPPTPPTPLTPPTLPTPVSPLERSPSPEVFYGPEPRPQASRGPRKIKYSEREKPHQITGEITKILRNHIRTNVTRRIKFLVEWNSCASPKWETWKTVSERAPQLLREHLEEAKRGHQRKWHNMLREVPEIEDFLAEEQD